jgi:hypothetical protein
MRQAARYHLGQQLDRLRLVTDSFAAGLLNGAPDDLLQHVLTPGFAWPKEVGDYLDGKQDGDWEAFDAVIDIEQVRHAQEFFATFGLHVGAALVHGALPDAYAAARGAQVLYLTGELVSRPERRIRETTQFVFDVMTPDLELSFHGDKPQTTLHPGQGGARSARRVRMFHQAVRRYLTSGGRERRWENRQEYFATDDPRGPALGQPLNQEDLLGTLLQFTVAVFDSLTQLGVPYTNDDKTAWFHVWDVVGRHLGIGTESAIQGVGPHTEIDAEMAEFLPLDADLSGETLDLIRQRHHLASHEGKILVNALLHELHRPLPRGMKPFPASLIRYLVGKEVADLLGITQGGWAQMWLDSLGRMARVSRRLRGGIIGGGPRLATSELSAWATRALLQQFIDQAGRADRPFRVQTQLSNAWGLAETR